MQCVRASHRCTIEPRIGGDHLRLVEQRTGALAVLSADIAHRIRMPRQRVDPVAQVDFMVPRRKEGLVLWRNPNYGIPGRARYNTSIILHTAGTRPEFWTDWRRRR